MVWYRRVMRVHGGCTGPARGPSLAWCAVIAAVAGAPALAGCGDAMGKCGAYADTPGTARITAISPAPAGQASCPKDPVQVLFDFTPTDPHAAARAASGVALLVGGGLHPPRAWVTAIGLELGTGLPAVRHDQPVGPCAPTVWTFPDVDQAAALAVCH